MLSRVAAVMAPRTHNRRRVTGSSGRRREGKESEPQRPNMSRHLLYSVVLLLLLVMMCCGTGGASSKKLPAPITSPKTYFDWRDKDDKETVVSLRVPSLVGMNGDIFAVAEAQCKGKNGNGEDFTGIASEVLTLSDEQKKVELDKTKMKTQVLLECPADKEKCASQNAALEGASADSKKKVHVSQPTTVVEGNDIYMLVGKCSQTAVGPSKNDAEDCGLLLAKGNVSGESSNKRIYWNEIDDLPRTYNIQQEALTALFGSGGSGIKMKDETLLFPVEGTKKKNKEGEKAVSLIIHNSKDTDESWKLSKWMSDGGCSDPSVVEWEKDKKLMMMTACDGGRRRVYESGDKGESWTEALGTLSRVWGNKKDEGAKGVRSGFITATIDGEDNRNVMLVTLPVYSKEDESKKKGKLHLWLTDNTHIVDIGPVSDDDDAAASSLLYKSVGSGDMKEEELIALYEKKKEDGKSSHSLWSVLLTEQLQRVKEVLATWKKVDETVSKLCPSESDVESTSPGNACSPTVKITDGLVGFLSGNFSDGTWRDEYLGVNATVKKKKEDTDDTGATMTSDGVKFTGAWAEWPVGAQGENQLYHFANHNFTLLATVSIDKVPEGITHIPLIGVKMNDNENSVLLGLSYDKEKKCILVCGGGTDTEEHSSTLATETTHHVAIVLRNGIQGSAYVNGQRVGGDEACELKVTESNEISHFYIGGDGNSARSEEGVSVTVTNVLLYNRPLSTAEIGALNANKVLIPHVVPDNGQETLSQSSSAGQPPSGPKLLNENQGAGGGSTSTSEPSTVTTSLGKEQSVIQLPSGIPSDGSKNVDAASSSNGNPRVGAETGGAVQGDTPPQTPVDTPDTADTNAPTATNVAQVDPADTTEMRASSGANEETAEGRDGQEELHARDGEVKAAALSSSLGNVSQGNNSDGGTVSGSGLLPSLLLLMLGLWVFAAL
ncbi:putative trans-sialidase, Group V [Trypanosoma cruzi]|nr:putative trans-sialidase, Group V [Trypanosoma cruzi]